MTPIKYIGKRDPHTEGAYGSKIVFRLGETINVDDGLAKKLLKHPDVYALGAEEGATEAVSVETKQEKQDGDTEEDLQAARDLVANMDKDALATYAKTNFSIDVDKRKGVDKLRAQVSGLIDQYGIKG